MAAPFGTRVRRFLNKGTHPGFETLGCLKSIPALGPGTYNLQLRKRHFKTPNWTRELRAEEYSRTLGGKVS